MAFTKIFAAVLLASGLASAAPTKTVRATPSTTVSLTGVTHSVSAGLGGLNFSPDNVVVEWHFLPANHTVAQSSFAEPCKPLNGTAGFFPGFQSATSDGEAPHVFEIVVESKQPIWYYCPQTTGNHCQKGMVGVINQNLDNQLFSLARHRELAAGTGVSIVPPTVRGGAVLANPSARKQC